MPSSSSQPQPPPTSSTSTSTTMTSSSSAPSASESLTKRIFTPRRIRTLQKMSLGFGVASVPVFVWWKWSTDQRQQRQEDVRTRVRVPNVQTLDDIMVERCRPGDVLLFDRRWEHCATGPVPAFVCMLGRWALCNDNDRNRVLADGKFDHCGIVVPGRIEKPGDEFDPSNLLLLEATPSQGIVARPLLTRLEMSQSRSVVLLPLALPGERRNDPYYEAIPNVVATEQIVQKKLSEFRDSWTEASQKQNYKKAHSTLGLVGAIAYAIGYASRNPGPTSPSAWLVTLALTEAKVAQTTSERDVKEAKVEDFLRDSRFQDHDVIRMRPGWRFLPPVSFRET